MCITCAKHLSGATGGGWKAITNEVPKHFPAALKACIQALFTIIHLQAIHAQRVALKLVYHAYQWLPTAWHAKQHIQHFRRQSEHNVSRQHVPRISLGACWGAPWPGGPRQRSPSTPRGRSLPPLRRPSDVKR